MTEQSVVEAELPLETSGAKLLRAREAAGLSRAQIAASTKIPERHLLAIENGDLGALPARTYAVGFSRSYARAVGLDEAAIIDQVRGELHAVEPDLQRRPVPTFEPGDPARIPGAKLAWGAAALGLIAVGAMAWFFWPSMLSPAGELPSVLATETPQAAASEAPGPAAPLAGPVVLTAMQPKVWIKVVDAAGNQLFQKELAQGETYSVPQDQAEALLSTARPDALAITIGGQPVAKLAETQQVMRNVPITAAALQARGTSQPVATPSAAAPVTGSGTAASGAAQGAAARQREQMRRVLRPQMSNQPAPAPAPAMVKPAVVVPVQPAGDPAPLPASAPAADR